MAKRKKNTASGSGMAAPNNRNALPSGRELVVVLEPSAGLRTLGAFLTAADETAVSDINGVLNRFGASIRPLFGSSEARLGANLAQLPDANTRPAEMTQFYRVDVEESQLDKLAAELQEQSSVKAAYVKPPAEPPLLNRMQPIASESPPVTPDFSPRQGYLGTAPAGVDAHFAWTVAGGRGDGVRVIDIEGAWLFTHEDLTANQGGVVGGNPINDFGWRNHGTAVVGVIGGDVDSKGVTGIAPNASQRAISIFPSVGSSQAIKDAADLLGPGDIILIELHRPGPRFNFQSRDDQRGYIAIEWWPDDFAAIRYAVGKGVIVVEAAGNGAENLDDPVYQTPDSGFPTNWMNPFRRSNRDSGAIVVGAGAPPIGTHGRDHGPDRSRLGFSNFGALIDAQGWGREVTTTGYGDLQGGDEREWYTDQFSGTSSASPIVVGSLACVQGALRTQNRPLLTPSTARSVLRSTGSPQQDAPGRPASQRIGTRPDIRQLLQQLLPSSSRPKLRLVELSCERAEDWAGPDEAYLQVNGQRVWGPMSMNNGGLADLRSVAPIPFRQRARVDLYDQDVGWGDRDDHLGATYAWATDSGRGEREHRFSADGSSYTLVYEVV